jgi:3',5'-cyclic-nucleotide phosphodiesterase
MSDHLNSADNQPFSTFVLGASGGLNEANLTSYLLAHPDADGYIAFDAGTLLAGIRTAINKNSFSDVKVPADADVTLEGWIMSQIQAYLITHPHLDHVSGLVLNSVDDTSKPIFGSNHTINTIRDHLFNWQVWPNFGNEGEGFQISKYSYQRVEPTVEIPIGDTGYFLEPHLLSHASPYESTAYRVRVGEDYVLFIGDSGADEVEGSDRLHRIFERIAPLVREGKLQGIYLEVSFPNGHPKEQLFGHLTPEWMMSEMRNLAELVNPDSPQEALQNLTVIVTAIKPSYHVGPAPRETITQELKELNDLNIRIIVPQQGQRINL